ncbi:hypothetical protein [Falsiroseomonas sp. HW251]|uniref:hypothetical protein n=1 Tax=Falsiroseomonas sp. HW251 TaxID=3390998 RepID=UPI003D3235DC
MRSTKETSRIKAREAAEELAADLLTKEKPAPNSFQFTVFAERFERKASALSASGERNANYMKTAVYCLHNAEWGLLQHFAKMDIRELRTRHWTEFLALITTRRPDLSPSTKNTLSATFRNVMKVARDAGVVDDLPATPRTKRRDNPRAFFRFHPLVPKECDSYKLLLAAAQEAARTGQMVRGTRITDELYDLILFMAHSFVRPTVSELYALRHNDVQIASDPKRLVITIRNGKTGYRVANTMPAAVTVYERILKRYPKATGEDFIFLPHHRNRTTGARVVARQFNHVLTTAGLKRDPATGAVHTVYSLRHTAICMRIIHSEGQVNIFNLAKNAGTSVEQIERFYARHLPLSAGMARNLQSFGGAVIAT